MKKFMMGNEILAHAAFEAGAKAMFGYPITPTTEVLATWARLVENTDRKVLQTEDEAAAGFGVIGVVLAGYRAFTATGGPGMILMQDPLAMAEAMRLPMIVFDGQRGGPSTGQVIYSQQEVNLAIYGGNGEGLRIVYSTSSLQDLYEYGKKVFDTAWKYKFPTILLYDGYQGKMKGVVEMPDNGSRDLGIKKEEPILTGNIRNTYNLEEELADVVTENLRYFSQIKGELIESEIYPNEDFDLLLCAHGIVAAAAKLAIDKLRQQGIKASLFRPITLSPFPTEKADEEISKAKKIFVFESSHGQFSGLIKDNVFRIKVDYLETFKPGLGFTPEEITEKVKQFA